MKKLWFWNRYVEITTSAMVGHPKWREGVVYVDLFAGPGVGTNRENGERFPGSPLIAAGAPKEFCKILLCELIADLASACETRLGNRISPDQFRVFKGDCNTQIDELAREIPDGALTLAFLDPTRLNLHFETIQTLAARGRVDLLILFPDAFDILRNADHYYFDQPESNLDGVLGPDSEWRRKKTELVNADGSSLRRLFATIYQDQLGKLAGYKHFATEVIYRKARPLYRLVYATKHPRGLDFGIKALRRN